MSDTPNNITGLVLARKEQEERELQETDAATMIAPASGPETAPAAPARRVEGRSFIASINFDDCKAGRFVDSKPLPIEWTFENSFQKGTVGLLVGAPGIGKSFLVGQIGASVAMDLPLFGNNLRPHGNGKVLAFFCEENEHMLHVRTHSMYNNIFNEKEEE